MTDKERILMWLVNRLYANALYARENIIKWKDMQPTIISNDNPLQVGDLVTTQTTFKPNDFIVGYVEEIQTDCVVIREIGSKRLCNYYNESFMRIDKSLLGNEILEGTQYLTYQKVLKAFSNSDKSYTYRFKSISFDTDICTVEARKAFSNDAVFSIKFKHNSKTTIKSITALINAQGAKVNLQKGAIKNEDMVCDCELSRSCSYVHSADCNNNYDHDYVSGICESIY